MGLPVEELLDRVSSSELAEWQAYEKVYGPLGEMRGDIQTAILAAVIHNQWSKPPKKPDAFMPEWDQPQTTTRDRLKAWVAQFGGSDDDDR